MAPSVLIVDDEKHTREGLKQALAENYDVSLAASADEAFNLMDAQPFDVILTDLRMPGKSGLKVIDRALALPNKPAVLMMTAYGNIDTAVEAMRRGAVDFLTKPVNIERLDVLIRRALKAKSLEVEVQQLHERLDEKFDLEGIVGDSPLLKEVIERVKKVAQSKATILIEGESGTGKELIAQAIHQSSPRSRGPFVAVHCAALSESLLESELFGHEKGSFTGRDRAADRALRVRRRGDPLPGRDRRDLRLDPGQAAALPRDQGDRPRGRLEDDRARRAPRDGDQPEPGAAGARGEVPRGPVLPPRRRALRHAAAAPARRGHPRAHRALRQDLLAGERRPAARGRARRDEDAAGLRVAREHPRAPEFLRERGRPPQGRQDFGVRPRPQVPGLAGRPRRPRPAPRTPASAPTLSVEQNEKRILREALIKSRGNRTKAAELMGISRRTLHRKLAQWPELDVLDK